MRQREVAANRARPEPVHGPMSTLGLETSLFKRGSPLIPLAKDFFADESDYVRHQRLRGKEISIAHLRNEQAKLSNYAIPFFHGVLLKNIDTQTMDRFRDMLVERGLSASSIRQTQVAVKQVFEWATRQRLMCGRTYL